MGMRKDSLGREEFVFVFREGGLLKVEGVELFWFFGVFDDFEIIMFVLEDFCKYYSLIF